MTASVLKGRLGKLAHSGASLRLCCLGFVPFGVVRLLLPAGVSLTSIVRFYRCNR